MKFVLATLLSACLASLASADLCVPTGLTGQQSYGKAGQKLFNLYARDESGKELPVTASQLPLNGTFFYPLSLAGKNAKKANLAYFQLQSGTVFAYGAQVLSTMNNPTLSQQPLFVSSDSGQISQNFEVINATCDGKATNLLRFSSLLTLAIGSASINGSFAKGTPLLSPILQNLITLPTALDLVISNTKV